ncbi:MAG: hypothetical protein ACR2L3_05695 [Actinomycetota bacterium]
MTTKNRNLTIAAGVLAAAILLSLTLFPNSPPRDDPSSTLRSSEDPYGIQPEAVPTAAPQGTGSSLVEAGTGIRSYSIGLHELSGLTQATPPGTRIDIWASWGPPVTEKPQVQRLLKDVVIQEIQPPFLPEGPTAVVLSLMPTQVEKMLWGDKYGSLAAVVRY